MTRIKVSNVLFNILLIITIISVGFVLFNICSGAKGYAVLSNSMAHTLNRGDAVFSRSVDFDSLKVGDIVTVKMSGSDNFFTHRIVNIDTEKRKITTKGDNNAAEDPMASDADNIVGKMWYSVPLIGYFSILFSDIVKANGLIILTIIAIILIALNIVFTRIKRKKRGDIDE